VTNRIVPAAVFLAALGVTVVARAPLPVSAQRIWFTPGPGTLDFQRLFEHPDEWQRARALITVFQFYQQHTQMPPASIVGPNSYDAFVRVDAFRRIRAWGMKTAMELGSVKEGYCLDEPDGMEASIQSTLASVMAVEAAGGTVDYLAQDEPFVSGRLRVCGGPALEPTADKVAAYMSAVQRRFPNIGIGLIEAYPFSSAATIETILDLLRARGTPPAFLHVDVDWRALEPGEFARDLPRLQAAARARGITFGVIVWGYNGDADRLFADDAADIANRLADAFGSWEKMPERIIFQSWAESSTGLQITPSNLPEDRAYAHTNIVLNLYRRLRGTVGGAVGTASAR
jgi:hypothetical protein